MNRTGSGITDEQGRILILRGVNLGGSSKIPSNRNKGPGFLSDPASVSFVGRPFPVKAAEEHFERLKANGLTFTRLIITWEALEHSGPGIYDEAYIDYLEKILIAAEKKGVSILMDPHQDVWSRWTGGDGAPAWTLEKLGMDLDKLEAVGAAIYSHSLGASQGLSVNDRKGSQAAAGKPRPMIWPVNYSLYAAATMFTLFFGGNVFAPETKIDGESAQDFLQNKYIAAFSHCYSRLKSCRAIAAWGVMNEPHPGFIGYKDLRGLENAALALGPVPGPFQAMMAASGRKVSVPVHTPWLKGSIRVGRKIINPEGQSLFKEGFGCPWKQAGVWAGEAAENIVGSAAGDVVCNVAGDTSAGKTARLLDSGYFSAVRGRPVRFTDDFLKPFLIRYIQKMGESGRTLFFIEGVPHAENPHWEKDESSPGTEGKVSAVPQNVVNAFHHYDGLTLFSKRFNPYFTVDNKIGKIILGKKKTAAHYSAKLVEAKNWAKTQMGDMPCFIGEFGVPFDLNSKKSYKTGDYSQQEDALSLYYDGIDDNLLGSTVWNYTANNTNEEGDHWNGEDLSILSNGKTRGEGGWLRPYPMATAGLPINYTWHRKAAVFYYRFCADANITAPTVIFIPGLWFSGKPDVSVKTISVKTASENNCLRTEYSKEEQKLFVFNDGYAGEVELWVRSAR